MAIENKQVEEKRKKFSFTETRFMKFLGGKDLLFAFAFISAHRYCNIYI